MKVRLPVGRAMRRVAFVLAAVLLLAGCGGPKSAASPTPFDGDAAFGFVAGLVQDAQGQPRFRVPGTASHDEAAAWLWDAMQVDGWSPHRQDFTGADYIAADKGRVAGYYEGSECSAEERTRLATLTFQNLWATYDSPGSDQLMLVGAHWESKRFANQDATADGRTQPVLGANDGASGVAEEGVDLPFDLGVAFFDGEDGFEDCHPLAGSILFAQRMQPGEVDRFLLLDMVGSPQARFVRESVSHACDGPLVDLLHKHAATARLAEHFLGRVREVSDDHLPFVEAGVPAADLIDYGRTTTAYGFPPEWHTTADTLDAVDAGMLGRVGDLLLLVLQDPSFVPDWPARCGA